jgi:DNA primase
MSIVEDIKARLDIVEVVSGYVTLQKSGRSFKAPCPFHTEKTPSFIVNPERQSWHCFGACATGGDAFSFVMRAEKLEFGEALRLLAQKTGISLSRERDSDRHEALYRVNQAAARFYQDALKSPQGQHVVKYLDGRGISAESRERFHLGLSPQGWDGLKSHLKALGFADDVAVEAGLLRRGDDGNTLRPGSGPPLSPSKGQTWDFFRGRLMFPIWDRQGRVTGFGARALDDSKPKYINTPQTPIFNKRGTLYGLHLAAEAIKAKNTGVVVEGYMDVIGVHQHGYTNAVASMGTALTLQQVSQLRTLARSFVMALDPDAAGQEATLRDLISSWQVFERQAVDDEKRSVGALYVREPLTLKVAALPPDQDPDDIVRRDPQQWERLTQDAVPLMDYLIPAIASRFDLSTGQGKAQVVETLFPAIAAVENPFEQERHFRKLAETLGVTQDALRASVGSLRRSRGNRNRERSNKNIQSNGPAAEVSASLLSSKPEEWLEDYALALLLKKPELREHVKDFSPEYFHKSEDREIFVRWLACSTDDSLREALDESLREHLTYLANKELAPTDRYEGEAALRQCLQRMERRHLQELQESILASGDSSAPPPREIEETIASMNARLKELFAQKIR